MLQNTAKNCGMVFSNKPSCKYGFVLYCIVYGSWLNMGRRGRNILRALTCLRDKDKRFFSGYLMGMRYFLISNFSKFIYLRL